MVWKELIIERITNIPLLEILKNNYSFSNSDNNRFNKISISLNGNSCAALNNIANWEFEWQYINDFDDGLPLGGYANKFLDEYRNSKKNAKHPFAKINIVDNSVCFEDYFNIALFKGQNEIHIGDLVILTSELNNYVIPFDVNLNGYNVCFVKTQGLWKLAMLDTNGLYWTNTKIISISQYLNFLLVSSGEIESRHNLFFHSSIEFAYSSIPRVLNW
jgi:hypothetical protein